MNITQKNYVDHEVIQKMYVRWVIFSLTRAIIRDLNVLEHGGQTAALTH